MQFTFSAMLLAFLAAPGILAMPTEAAFEAQTDKLDKRDGHVNVHTDFNIDCTHDQGTTAVGTGGKCVNMSLAKSWHTDGAASSPCSKGVVVQYYVNTGCVGATGLHTHVNTNTCVQVPPKHGSAHMFCGGPGQ